MAVAIDDWALDWLLGWLIDWNDLVFSILGWGEIEFAFYFWVISFFFVFII